MIETFENKIERNLSEDNKQFMFGFDAAFELIKELSKEVDMSLADLTTDENIKSIRTGQLIGLACNQFYEKGEL